MLLFLFAFINPLQILFDVFSKPLDKTSNLWYNIYIKGKADNPNRRRRKTMRTAKIYTWYDFMDGGKFAPCCVRQFDKERFDHSCEQELGLIITIPDGYRLSENENGDPLLVPENGGENIMLTYDVDRNCVMDYALHTPIEGVRIVGKVSYYD